MRWTYGQEVAVRRCPHGHYCLVNAGRLLHPPGMTVCEEDDPMNDRTEEEGGADAS